MKTLKGKNIFKFKSFKEKNASKISVCLFKESIMIKNKTMTEGRDEGQGGKERIYSNIMTCKKLKRKEKWDYSASKNARYTV